MLSAVILNGTLRVKINRHFYTQSVEDIMNLYNSSFLHLNLHYTSTDKDNLMGVTC